MSDDHAATPDRGPRGVQGPRGPAGADSGSVQKLTEVLEELKAQLIGLRKDVQIERRGRRLSMAVIGVALAVAALVGGIGYANYRQLADSQAVEIAANSYDQEAGAAEACQRDNTSRASRRRLFIGLYDLVASTPPAVPRTPAEQDTLDGFLLRARANVEAETVLIDCDTVAPMPEGERPS